MTRQRIPDEVLDAAHARARAREARDWAEADRLRAEIEAAGWKVADRGTDFALTPAAPPDVADGDCVRYGSSASVPSLLDARPSGVATVVLVATDWPDDLERALAGLRRHDPAGTSIVIVANDPSAEQVPVLEGMPPDGDADIVWTSERVGHATALNMGLRRAAASVVVLLDTSVEATGDVVSPLVEALDDPTVAVAGGWGITSSDLRRFDAAPQGDVDAIEAYALAFRRADVIDRGPLDEHFRFYRNLDIWWSFVLRDQGEGATPRRAISVELPALRHEHRGWTSLPDGERDRQSKRNFYRIIDRFGSRQDLLIAARGAQTSRP